MTGAMPLCEQGCGMVNCLVILGDFAGMTERWGQVFRYQWYNEELDKDIAYLSS